MGSKNRNKSTVQPMEKPMNDKATQENQTEQQPAQDQTTQEVAQQGEQTAAQEQATQQPETVVEQAAAPVVEQQAAQTPVAAPVQQAKVEAVIVKQSKLEKMIEKAMVEGSISEKQLIAYFNAYIDSMAPGKPMEPRKGAGHQQTLWRGIMTALNDDANFDKTFPLMINFVKEHRNGVFSDAYTFRFTEEMTLSKEQLTAFNSFLVMLQIAAGLNNKQDMKKQVDLNKLMTPVFKEETRQRLIAYFN